MMRLNVMEKNVCSIIGYCYYSFQALAKYILLNAR